MLGEGLTGDVAGRKTEEREEGICCTDVAGEDIMSRGCCSWFSSLVEVGVRLTNDVVRAEAEEEVIVDERDCCTGVGAVEVEEVVVLLARS